MNNSSLFFEYNSEVYFNISLLNFIFELIYETILKYSRLITYNGKGLNKVNEFETFLRPSLCF